MTRAKPHPFQFDQLPKYRAPSEHATSLVTPSLPELTSDATNWTGQASASDRLRFGGWSLDQIRRQAREDAWTDAVAHTKVYRDGLPTGFSSTNDAVAAPWIVAGHQPELFHPGVWFKNFLLSEAARVHRMVPINLVIDNDLCRSPGIKVPTHDASLGGKLRLETVLFDTPTAGVAWECRTPVEPASFASFPQRVREQLTREISEPLVERMWPAALEALLRTGRLGAALAEGRHALEAELGLQTLELPLSTLASQRAFARFSLEVLSRLERFQQAYNSQRAAYRAANHIRNEAHPVPALTSKAGWFEAPWWVYRFSAPTRRRLFVQMRGSDLFLSDHAGWQAVIEGPLDTDDAVAQWRELAMDGILVRPRALITTMFVRLVVSDLFVHGIGGGKYDQITDAIIQDFWDVAPPPMCVGTATLRLPIRSAKTEHPVDLIGAHQTLDPAEQLRRLRYHAEEFIFAPDNEAQALIARKQELLKSIPPRGEKWNWHREMTRITTRLAELTTQQRQAAEESLRVSAEEAREDKLAKSREYSFCLFELPRVADELKRLASAAVNPPLGK